MWVGISIRFLVLNCSLLVYFVIMNLNDHDKYNEIYHGLSNMATGEG